MGPGLDDVPSELHAEESGAGPRLVLVHGFAQTRRCWGLVGSELERDHRLVRIDIPGHGRSGPVLAGLRTGGRLIADVGGRATYLGYSLGGRLALHLALANPELVDGLVLLGATPGIEDPAERAARAAADHAAADRLQQEGLEPFLDAWLSQPLFAGLDEANRFREERRENTVDGLAESLRQAGTGAQDPRWHLLPRLDMPVLVTAGQRDEKFSEVAERMAATIGANATLALVPDAGHAAHLENPEGFLSILRPWLAAHDL